MRGRAAVGATFALVLLALPASGSVMFAHALAEPFGVSGEPSPSPSWQNGLQSQLTLVDRSAPVGGTLRVTGRTDCEQAYVTLEFYSYSGAEDHVTQRAPTRIGKDRYYHFDFDFVIPAAAAPGEDYPMWAQGGCGNPDEARSDIQHPDVTPADMRIVVPESAAAGAPLSIKVTACYGSRATTIPISLSRYQSQTLRATRKMQEASINTRIARDGVGSTLTVSVATADCPGSHAAQATVRISRERPSPSRSPIPRTALVPSPSAEATVTRAAPSASALPTAPDPSGTSPQTAAAPERPVGSSGLPLIYLAVGLGGAAAAGVLFAIRRRDQ